MRVLAGRSRAAEPTQRLSNKSSPPVREVLVGRYSLTSLLGCGGMAEVFEAYDRQLERIVAIKRPRSDGPRDPLISERLHREALALAAIDSPRVVAIHDVGFTSSGVFLVMQRLRGRTLDEEIDRNGPVTPARACRIARDILAGVGEIHARGLVHRDLKASNVLLDETDRAVLLDLGAALHPRRRPLTAPGTVLGTPECMAPEQLEQGELDGRVDLYQLGLMLLYLLTGVMAATTIDPKALPIPSALREVIYRSRAPIHDRYASVAEMASGLERALSSCTLVPIEPVPAIKQTRRYPMLRPQDRTARGTDRSDR
jgi:serine/threonine protein kinase